MSNTKYQLMLATRLRREDAAVLQAHADRIGTTPSALVRTVLLNVIQKLKAQSPAVQQTQAEQAQGTTTEGQPNV